MLSEGLSVRSTSVPGALVRRGKRVLQHPSSVYSTPNLKDMALHTPNHTPPQSQDVSDAHEGNTRWDLSTIVT